MEILKFSDLDLSKTYSYADYLRWQFEERVELIKGKLFKMSPAPSRKHQELLGLLYEQVLPFKNTSRCKVYLAPFDVRLPKESVDDGEVYTVVQPDLCIICDQSKLDKRGCIGAPDLVVEILSPGNSKREMSEKFNAYEQAGVKEYWLVNYLDKNALVYVLNQEGQFIGKQPFTDGQVLISYTFPSLTVDLTTLFQES